MVKTNLNKQKQHFQIIDLYAEHFNPVYDKEELRLYHEGETHDPLVTKYLTMLQKIHLVLFLLHLFGGTAYQECLKALSTR